MPKDPMELLALLAVVYSVALFLTGLAVIRHGRAALVQLRLHQSGGRWLWLGPIAALILCLILDQGVVRLVRASGVSEVHLTSNVWISEIVTSPSRMLLAVLVTGLLAPLGEELVFRGQLYGWVEGRFGGVTALIVSSLVFAAFHVESIHVALVLPIGVLLGWLRLHTGLLLPAIAAHMTINTFVVIATYFWR